MPLSYFFVLIADVSIRLVVVSREQLVKEAEALGNKHTDEEYDWGLISVKGQLENFELPMTPMTMLRYTLISAPASSIGWF
jgi:hypothetical protein